MKQPFYISQQFEIKKHGQTFLNHKRIVLLKMIEQKGSIRGASSAMKMSYQQAWHFVKEMNELSPLPLAIYKRGGTTGGGTELTKTGKEAIEEFEKLNEQMRLINKGLSEDLWVCHFSHQRDSV